VLQVLAERGYEVVAIAGTSMGALVGGVTAAGKLAEYTEWALSLTRRQILRLLDPTFTGGGALRAERVIDTVAQMLGGVLIEDCQIPFTAVATDLTQQREVWFQHGPVHTAIRASIAIPTVITPVVVDGHMLVDGGLMNPVPLEPTRGVMADLTVAVSLSGPPGNATVTRAGRGRRPSLPVPGVRGTDAQPSQREGMAGAPSTAMADVVGASLDTMGAVIARYRMAGNPPDVLVTISRDACRTMDFHLAAEMIALGRDRAIHALASADG